jgi:hypothetical protein
MAVGQLHDENPDLRTSQTSLHTVDEAIAHVPNAVVEEIMGNPETKHIIDRFWDLDTSDQREIALELGLISEEEVAWPAHERYGVALIRASERNLLDQLEKLIQERE